MHNIDKKQLAIIGFIIGTILFGAGFKIGQSKEKPSDPLISEDRLGDEFANKSESKENNGDKNDLVVYVSGAVKKPGLYHLKSGARVADAIYLAGAAKGADLENINLAETVTDSQQIQVSFKELGGSSSVSSNNRDNSGKGLASGGRTSTKSNGKVNINRAKVDELDELPGIGPSTAQKIIDYRSEHGSFKSINELTSVTGIGEKKFEKIKELITV